MLQRLWPRRPAGRSAPEISRDDWAPVPAATLTTDPGGTDWCAWLQEDASRSRHATGPLTPAELRDPVTAEEAVELAEPAPPAPRPTPTPGSLERLATLIERERAGVRPRPRTLSRPRLRTPSPGDRRWRDVLTEFAEHLTDEELAIIRRQMGS